VALVRLSSDNSSFEAISIAAGKIGRKGIIDCYFGLAVGIE
jgi:hypothetical protein